jgi:hypothetical protein
MRRSSHYNADYLDDELAEATIEARTHESALLAGRLPDAFKLAFFCAQNSELYNMVHN